MLKTRVCRVFKTGKVDLYGLKIGPTLVKWNEEGALLRVRNPAQIVQFDSAGFAPAITRLKDGLLASEGEVSAKKPSYSGARDGASVLVLKTS